MSELAVGSLKGLAANSFVIDIAAGSTLNVPPPAILQVVSTTLTTNFSASLNSGQFTPVTGLSATITPSSSSSKMFVSFSAPNASSQTDRNSVAFRLLRDSTEIGSSTDASGSMTRGITGNFLYFSTASAIVSNSASFLDSPATTSSITYSVNVGNSDTSTMTVLINRTNRADSNTQTYRLSSTITVMEVAG